MSTDSHMTHPKNAPSYNDSADQMEKLTRKEPDMLDYSDTQFTKGQDNYILNPSQQRIKDAFQTLGHTTTTAAPGTGEIAAAYDWKQTAAASAPAEAVAVAKAPAEPKTDAEVAADVNDFSDQMDTRNVADEFKGMPDEQIREILDTRRTKMVSVLQNLTSDFNKSTCIRLSNAFSVNRVHFLNRVNEQNPSEYTGVKRYNRTGTVGTHVYENISHTSIEHWRDLFAELHEQGYTIFAVDNVMEFNPESVYDIQFPELSCFVYGEEKLGLAKEVIEACDRMVYIPQTGSVRSLNVGTAYGIVTAFYTAQHRK